MKLYLNIDGVLLTNRNIRVADGEETESKEG